MMWCANEAIKDLIKKRVQRCITASISQDGQGATLGVRMCVISHGSGNSTVKIGLKCCCNFGKLNSFLGKSG